MCGLACAAPLLIPRAPNPRAPTITATAAVLLIVIGITWEGAKALFGIPDQKLPHLWAILSEFGTPTLGGSGPILGL